MWIVRIIIWKFGLILVQNKWYKSIHVMIRRHMILRKEKSYGYELLTDWIIYVVYWKSTSSPSKN